MFIKYETKKYKGKIKTYVRIVESYREGGVSKHRPIKAYGYLEDQVNQAEFIKKVNEELKILEQEAETSITLTIKAKENDINGLNNIVYNYGYKYLESIYNFLKIDEFLNKYQSGLDSKEKYKISEIFKFLVIERMLAPDSKRASLQHIDLYYQLNNEFSLDDVYRSLDLLEPIYKDFQLHLRNKVASLNIQNKDYIYYDVTNYYCEIDFNDLLDGLRKRGVSKEHRVDPIVGLGLFLDSNGLPISFQIFPGNQAESTTLIPGIDEVKKVNKINRIICVADKGLNSNNNILKLINNNDGYLFSQVLRGKKGKRFQDKLFNDENWITKFNSNGELVYKYKTYEEEIEIKKDKVTTKHKQKVLLYWDLNDEILARKKRDEKVSKAKKSLTNGAYQIEHGYKKYIKDKKVDLSTLEVNEDLISDEEKYDGYYCLVTSELHLDHNEIRKIYHNLWEIEDTFRVTKTNLEFRPIYHFKKEHIISHFLICFTSLLILRLFQYKLKRNSINLSIERIIRLLNKMNLEKTNSNILHLHSISGAKAYKEVINKNKKPIHLNSFDEQDEIEKDLKLLDLVFTDSPKLAYIKIEKFTKYLNNIVFHTTTA